MSVMIHVLVVNQFWIGFSGQNVYGGSKIQIEIFSGVEGTNWVKGLNIYTYIVQ